MLDCLDQTTFMVGSNVGSSGLVGRVLEVASITCWCSIVSKILHHFVCFTFVPDGVFTNRLRHVEYEGTGKSNGCNDSLQQCLSIAYRGDSRDFLIKRLRGMIDMGRHVWNSIGRTDHCCHTLRSKPLFSHVCQWNTSSKQVSEQALSKLGSSVSLLLLLFI